MARLFDRRAPGEDLTVSTQAGSPIFVAPDEIAVQMEHLWVRLALHRPAAPSSLAVTSYLRGEGVSVVASALALAASRRGPTLLVDGNLARPNLLAPGPVTATGTGTGIDAGAGEAGSVGAGPGGRGLRAVLEGSATIDEVVIDTDQDQLSILPVGSGAGASGEPRPPIELQPGLARELLAALSMLYPTVIVDAPSMQEPSAALAMVSACESTLLTVRHGVTDIDQVTAAADELAGVDLLGVVLNDARLRTPSWLRSRLGDLR